jgi:hypothetical protein
MTPRRLATQERGAGECVEKSLPTLKQALLDPSPVAGLTHRFYRYPARFPPPFARSVIQEFTEHGDTVVDPFMGGGTVLVEALAHGRRVIGVDLNPLATFVARAKTTPLSTKSLRTVRDCLTDVKTNLKLTGQNRRHYEWFEYQRNLPWWLRKTLEIALDMIEELPTSDQRRFARAVLLRTAQWALDSRTDIPGTRKFLDEVLGNCDRMSRSLRTFSQKASTAFGRPPSKVIPPNRRLLTAPAEALSPASILPQDWCRPRLILTSPPYWGVHILYHRWQVQSRRETPAPYWLVGRRDGRGASYYTFSDRRRTDNAYLDRAEFAFRAVVDMMDSSTTLVQLVGFAQPETQLPMYLEMLERLGLGRPLPDGSGENGPKFSRTIPNRKWYANERACGTEVLMIHRRVR